MPSQYKLVPVKPLTGLFDARSLPDAVGAGSFALVKNLSVRSIGKRCRRGGWVKLFSGVNASYNNEDLHDQLIGLQWYYESYTTQLTGGGDFDHLAYVYYYPSGYIDGSSSLTDQSTGYLGDPYGAFPPAFTPNACFLDFYYDFPPTTYYRLKCHQGVDGVDTLGYPYGPYEAIYNPSFGYQYDYCGTVPLLRGGCREAITYLAEFRSPRNLRKLIAGTKSRLYTLNERNGNWRILADGLGGIVFPETDCSGCSPRRFLSAQLDSILLLTNDFDPPLFWFFDDGPGSGQQGGNCDLWSAHPIPDLQDLNITKAGAVAVHKGFAFFADLEQDGAYYPHRVIWSDFKEPISFIPTEDSIAGFQDIGSGERILRMEPLGDYLYIYTDQAIHRGSLVSTDEIWNFEQIYRGPDAIKYKFSLVNTGDEHYYLANDKLMRVTLADADPEEVAWMRATSIVIFDGIDAYETLYGELNNDQCDLVTGGYNGNLKEMWFSWPTGTGSCPNVSVVFNLTRNQEAADLVDHGFTAFCNYESDPLPTVSDFLIEQQVCSALEMAGLIVKEGPALVGPVQSMVGAPTSIWNATEDPDLPADPNSLCSRLATTFPEDLCKSCSGIKRFVMASASDYTLKEYRDDLYYRERLSGATYVQDGYSSILESGAEWLGIDAEKVSRMLKVEYKAEPQTTPNLLHADLAYGVEANCRTWKNIRKVLPDGTIDAGVPLRCLSEFDLAEHEANKTRPGKDATFPCSIRGKFFSYRLRIVGTGGGCCIGSIQLDVARAEQ